MAPGRRIRMHVLENAVLREDVEDEHIVHHVYSSPLAWRSLNLSIPFLIGQVPV